MAGLTLSIEGLNKAIKDIKIWQVKKIVGTQRAIIGGSAEIITIAKRNAPVLTGRLRADTQILATRQDELGTVLGNTVVYAPIVEANQPYLLPAYKEVSPKIVKTIAKQLGQV